MLANTLEITYNLGDTYTGVIATPQLVGRADILQEVLAEIHVRKKAALVYMVGPGGVGKTRLLKHILHIAAQEETLLVASDLIDLYHIRNRSVGGLIQSLLDVVDPINRLVKERPQETQVDDKLDELSRAEQEGLSTAELISRREELTKTLLALVNQLTQKKRLVLALDTAERLFVTPDQAQRRLGLSQHRPAILEWLLGEFLPNLENTVILVAGRPEPLNLTAELRSIAQTADRNFLPLTIMGLTESEALAYFESVIQRAETSGNASDRQAANAIRGWSDSERRTIFYCLHDGEAEPRIRPILLALAIDHLIVAGRPLAALVRPLAEAKALSNVERRGIEEQLGKALVQNLHEFRRPADDVILTLGWLRKGADIPLLSELTDLEETEVERALAQIRDLSFVKIRPADQRLFLHDEMYDLLQRYSLERRSPSERHRIFTALQQHYALLIQQARSLIEGLYRPEADTFQETLPDPLAVRDARARLQDAMVEDLYYRLHWNATDAFQQYFLYTEEAMGSSDEILWTLLRAEVFGFLATESTNGNTAIDSLRHADVIADSAGRWVEWLYNQAQFAKARTIADQIIQQDQDLVANGEAVFAIHLNIWRALLYSNDDQFVAAENTLKHSIEQLKSLVRQSSYPRILTTVLARAYYSSGYVYSRQTRSYEAIAEFAKAIPLWETVKLAVQLAAGLNDRAFDLGKLGQFHVAIPLAKAGLKLREQLGPRTPVGLSINTIAQIELAQYDFAGGLRDAQRAVQIFERLNSLRGLGFALIARSDANRRNAHSVTNVQQGKSATWLAHAVDDASRAVAIFTKDIEEPFQLRKAFRELGKAYSEWARIRLIHPALIAEIEAQNRKYSVAELTDLSEQAFQQALEATKIKQATSETANPKEPENLKSERIDILIDWILLYWYTALFLGAPDYENSMAKLENRLLAQIDELIPRDFQVPPAAGSHPPRIWLWVQAGYLHMLRGHFAFGQWYQQKNDDTHLTQAIEHYTLCLACHSYFSEYIFQEVRRALNNIYEHLILLTAPQKVQVYDAINLAEEKYQLGIGESRMSQFMIDRFGPKEVFSFIV